MAKASSDRISHAGEPDSATTKLHAPAGKAPEVTKGTAMKKRETDASPDMPTEVSSTPVFLHAPVLEALGPLSVLATMYVIFGFTSLDKCLNCDTR
jgi:hypothetical protein